MIALGQFETAAAQMQSLAENDRTKKLLDSNEAENRLLLIDDVLEILGWHRDEFKPEQATLSGDYTDYRLTIDGNERLIVEAKRMGVLNPLPNTIKQREYQNGTLYKNCGVEIQQILDQCLRYCRETGIPYALATNGNIWIVFMGFKKDIPWRQLKSFVFHSLQDVCARFSEFYGLVSREAVQDNGLEEKFVSALSIKPAVAIRPLDNVDALSHAVDVPEKFGIDKFFEWFMDDITRREEMLEYCYVNNRELREFSREIRQLWEYDPLLEEEEAQFYTKGSSHIDEMDDEKLEQELSSQFEQRGSATILLVGHIGAGKSTFIHKFNRSQIRRKQDVCVVVDLINEATINVHQDRAEEQHISELVLSELAKRHALDPDDPGVLRKCFEPEMAAFRKQHKTLFTLNPDGYALREEDELSVLSKDKYKRLIGYITYAQLTKKRKVWIAFDNVDRGSDSYQAFVYSFAHRLADKARCTTLITLREDTYLDAKESGFLDVRRDKIFLIQAVDLGSVVAKRRKYVERLIQTNKLPKLFRPYEQLVSLLNWHITNLLLLDDKFALLLITSFSLKNIRAGLSLLRSYYTSYHSAFHDFYQQFRDLNAISEDTKLDYEKEHVRLIQALMLRNGWFYQEEESRIFNIFSVDATEKGSHFLMLGILAHLMWKRNPTSSKKLIKYTDLRSRFIAYGYNHLHIDNAIRRLLEAQLIISPKLPISLNEETLTIGMDRLPASLKVALSLKGYYYLNVLASNTYYQTRVGEDTIWYDRELAQSYTNCLKESINTQTSRDHDDFLQATRAREIFMDYLKKSFFEEMQNNNVKEWLDIANIIERNIFGKSVLVLDSTDNDAESADQINGNQPSPVLVLQRNLQRQLRNVEQTGQTSFFAEVDDRDKAVRKAIESIGPMPFGKLQKSRYIVRVLWALELASLAGLGPQRASDIARAIRSYGNESVEPTNVAKFFREQRHKREYTHLWKEDPIEAYSINPEGREMLTLLSNRDKSQSTDNLVSSNQR